MAKMEYSIRGCVHTLQLAQEQELQLPEQHLHSQGAMVVDRVIVCIYTMKVFEEK